MSTFDDVATRFAAMSARASDLTAAMEVCGAQLVRQTSDNFRGEKEADGTPFVQLKTATIDARIAKVGGFKRTKKGAFTKGALKKQQRMTAPGGIKILTDTARAKNSVHTTARADGLTYSAVGYLGTHMTGTAKVPRRNPTPFVRVGNGWSLVPSAAQMINRVVRRYILTGEARA